MAESGDDSHECPQCGYEFDSERALLSHTSNLPADHDEPSAQYFRKKRNKDGDYECKQCGKTFATARGRHIHQYKACQQYDSILRDWQESNAKRQRQERIQALFGPNFQLESLR